MGLFRYLKGERRDGTLAFLDQKTADQPLPNILRRERGLDMDKTPAPISLAAARSLPWKPGPYHEALPDC